MKKCAADTNYIISKSVKSSVFIMQLNVFHDIYIFIFGHFNIISWNVQETFWFSGTEHKIIYCTYISFHLRTFATCEQNVLGIQFHSFYWFWGLRWLGSPLVSKNEANFISNRMIFFFKIITIASEDVYFDFKILI